MAIVVAKMKFGLAVVEVEAEHPKQLFQRLGAFAEMLQVTQCGCCKSPAIYPEHRRAGDGGQYEYFSWRCSACKAQLDFGQHKSGKTLFVKRGDHPATGGWYVYQGGAREQDQGQAGGGGWEGSGGNAAPPPRDEDIPF